MMEPPGNPERFKWSYDRWFRQIIEAVKGEYGCELVVTPETQWRNVEDSVKLKIAPQLGGAQVPN